MNRKTGTLALIGAALTLGGCQSYLERNEFVEAYTANTKAHNNALQVIDPWPPYATNTDIPTSGQRQTTAVGKYRAYGEKTETQQVQPLQLVVPNN
ncbi:MAG: hypothetical protein WBO55_03115 [Rhizobiaceae bacterium]